MRILVKFLMLRDRKWCAHCVRQQHHGVREHLLCPSLGMLSHWHSHLSTIMITLRTHILHPSWTAPHFSPYIGPLCQPLVSAPTLAPALAPLSPLACSCSSPPTLWHHWSQWSYVNPILAITHTCLPLTFSYIRLYVLTHVLYKWEVIVFDNHLWNKLDSWVLTPLTHGGNMIWM